MKDFWIKCCTDLALREGSFYVSARKTFRRVHFVATEKDLRDDFILADCGFTNAKMSMLHRYYFVEDSIAAARGLWERRVGQGKYGSVGFHCYGHFVKRGGNAWDAARAKKSGKPMRASVMGPCIQSVVITLTNKKRTSIDVFWRSSELFKKWPADLLFLQRDLLTQFDFSEAPIQDIGFHFANVTIHPMYAVTIMPLLDDPVAWIRNLRNEDKYFHDWVVKWTARYVCDEYHRGIAKFMQAMRTRKDALERLRGPKLRALQRYCRDHHPGHQHEYEEDDDE